MPQAERRTSRIAGSGLFSTVPIAAGDTVLHQDGIGQLNHSCDPNLGWEDAQTLVAIRDIAADDELTLDYATVVADAQFALVCHCETYRCRQMIEGGDWQIPQLQQRYRGYWHPDIARRIAAAAAP